MILALTAVEAEKLKQYNKEIYNKCYEPKNGRFFMPPFMNIYELEKIWPNNQLQLI